MWQFSFRTQRGEAKVKIPDEVWVITGLLLFVAVAYLSMFVVGQ